MRKDRRNDDDAMRRADAELVKALRQPLDRIRRLIDKGKLNDRAVVAFVRSVEERLDAGQLDEITLAEVERLTDLSHELAQRSGAQTGVQTGVQGPDSA